MIVQNVTGTPRAKRTVRQRYGTHWGKVPVTVATSHAFYEILLVFEGGSKRRPSWDYGLVVVKLRPALVEGRVESSRRRVYRRELRHFLCCGAQPGERGQHGVTAGPLCVHPGAICLKHSWWNPG